MATGGQDAAWRLRHVPPLDGLRGAAVAAVLLYHAEYLDGGYLGVDLFFVLSGFLITSLLLGEEADTGGIKLRSFWARRARRLLPALLLLLVGITWYAAVVARPVDLGVIRQDGLATLGYVANWSTILRGTSYWDISLAPSPLQHTWSLAIEEQFYLIWPLVVLALARWGRWALNRTVLVLSLGLAAVSTLMFVLLPLIDVSETRVYEGTDTRATAILLGAAWAAWRSTRPAMLKPPRYAAAFGWLGAAALAVAWLNLDGQSPWLYRGGLPLCSLLAAVVVASVTLQPDSVLGRMLSWAPLRGLGLVSYGLYLWHWPVYLVLTEQRLGYGGVRLLGVRLVSSLALSVISYLAVEQPIRRGAVTRWRATAAVPAGVAVAALALVVSTSGAVDSVLYSDTQLVAEVEVPGAPHVAFVGDSVAGSLVRNVTTDPVHFGVNPIDASRMNCSVVADGLYNRQFHEEGSGDPMPPCGDHAKGIVEAEQADLIVMLFGMRPGFEVEFDSGWSRACEPEYDQETTERFRSFAQELTSDGAQLVALTMPYPPDGLMWMPEGMDALVSCVNAAMTEGLADVPGTHVVDLNQLVCPDPSVDCVGELDGEPIRSDGLHFDDGDGGRSVADWVLDQAAAVSGVAPVHGA